jgi:YVTN family beta-propeller protein
MAQVGQMGAARAVPKNASAKKYHFPMSFGRDETSNNSKKAKRIAPCHVQGASMFAKLIAGFSMYPTGGASTPFSSHIARGIATLRSDAASAYREPGRRIGPAAWRRARTVAWATLTTLIAIATCTASAQTSLGNIAAGNTPKAFAINPVTNKIYVANQGDNTVTMIDGATNITKTIMVGNTPIAVAINPVTNQIYVLTQVGSNVTVIDGATNNITNVTAGTTPIAIAINPVTNKIYVANNTSNNVTVIDGATNIPSTVTAGTNPLAVAVNLVTNQIYVANGGSNNVTVIDGATTTTSAVTAGTQPIGVAINPVTNQIYVANNASNNVTVINVAPTRFTNHATAVTMAGGNVTSLASPTLSLTVSGAYSPTEPAIRTVYYRVNDRQGAFTAATGSGSGPYSAMLSGLALGFNTVSLFAVDAMEGTSINTAGSGFGGNSLMIGAPRVFAFVVVAPPVISTASALSAGTVGVAYNQTIAAHGGVGALSFAVTAQALPAGLSLSTGGVISGIPTASVNATFAVTVTDASGGSSVTPFTLSISQATQTITGFAPATPVVFGAAAATLSAVGGASGNAIIFTTTSANTICTVASNQLTFVGAGICNLTANQAGNANYTAAAPVSASVTINQATQTITGFTPATPVVFGAAAATLSAVGGASGNAIIFATTSANTICTVAGNQLTFVGAGICNLTANQAGNANYTAAAPVSASVTINQATQAITGFAPATPVVFGAAAATLSAVGGASGNAITFATTSANTICTVASNQLTFVGAGICNLTANQAGNANYTAAALVSASVTINQATQTITFPTIAGFAAGGSSPLSATASSGLTVTYSVTAGACTLAGSSVSAPTAGSCTLAANQAGNTNFSVAAPVSRIVTVSAAPLTAQTLNFPTIASFAAGGSSPLVAVASSGLAVTYTVTSGACAIVGNTVTASAAGTCVIAANQAGNASFSAAAQVTQSVTATAAAVQVNREFSLGVNVINPLAGTPITLTALVRGLAPNGLVSFTTTFITAITNPTIPVVGCTNQPVLLLPADNNAAVVTCVVFAEAGAHRYTATYSGDSANALNAVSMTTNSQASGPLDYNDIWWAGAAESGWGITISQKGLQQFNAFYVYDAAGKPVWYVMSGGSWNADFTRFTGAIYQPTGSLFSSYDARRWQVGAAVGSGTLTFTDTSNAVFDFTINGVTAQKNITRFSYGTPDAAPKIVVRDTWWAGEAENGWGVAIAQQDRSLFATWYTYGADGKATWFVMSGGSWVGTRYSGPLYTTASSAWLGVPYNAAAFSTQIVGSVNFDFSTANTAKMTYTVNGVTQTKVITRLEF